jgi:L-alanine-DL-glutamate epimerase-like enolase superfamily enzyme
LIKLNYFPFQLQFKTPFKIAHGVRTSTPIVLVQLYYEGMVAYGEASLPPYLTENQESVISFLQQMDVSQLLPDKSHEEVNEYLSSFKENYAAKTALDIAFYDLKAKLANQPLYHYLGLTKPNPDTFFTLGIDSESSLKEKLLEAKPFKTLKIKLNGENDKTYIQLIRKYSNQPIAIDANQAWNNVEEAIELVSWLETQNVVLIEQPFPKHELEKSEELKEYTSIPIIADESFQSINDLDKIANYFDGINIKLMKCGGIYNALKIIKKAKQNNLKIMQGCMTETSCGISAAASISSLANFVDLDSPLLTKNDPFSGINYKNGKLEINENVGLGLSLTES